MKLRDYQTDLVRETALSWRQGYRRPCIVLPCGGGKSIIVADIAKRTTDNGKNVLFLVHRKELCQQIRNTFSDYGVNMDRCTVGMVQTLTRRVKKLEPPALIITDENHHCLAKSYKTIYNAFPDAHCVGVTATPIRLNGDGLGDINDKLLIGPGVKELIRRRCLAPFDYFAPSALDLRGIRTCNGEYIAGDLEQVVNRKQVYSNVIKAYREKAGGRKAICYCVSILHSQITAERFREAGIPALHIDGNTPTAERDRAIEQFRSGEVRILCNVDLISEGFDVPDCGASILLRPTKSLTLFIQQSMRCMRYQPDKRAVILDHAGNYLRFGLPSDEREWSLEIKEKNKKKKEPVSVTVKTCPACFAVVETKAIECPQCGHMFEKQQIVPEEIEGLELEEVSALERAVRDYSAPSQCRTYSELLAYAKKKGYKPGWAYYQAKARGLWTVKWG